MSSAILMERTAFSSVAPGASNLPGTTPGAGFCVVPRCQIEIEKCKGGFKLHCRCEDDIATGTLQNLCKSLAGGMCSCICTLNGITCCQCNFCCGNCKCELTDDGCCITCTSGDTACSQILQSCCECISTCLKSGCCCYLCFNNTPVCCCCS